MIVLLIAIGFVAVVAAASTLIITSRDGYRAMPAKRHYSARV